MLTSHHLQESSGTSAERRVRSRQKLRSVSYIDLGPDNGGLVLNLSESGLAFFSAMKLTGDQLPTLSFKLPGFTETIEAQARLAWISETRKEAGVQFDGLPEEHARKISDWLSAEQGLHNQLAEAAVSPFPQPANDGAPAAEKKLTDNYSIFPSRATDQFTPEVPRFRESGPAVMQIPYPGSESFGPTYKTPPKRTLARSVPIFAAVAILAFVAGLAVNRRGQPTPSKRTEPVSSPAAEPEAAENALGKESAAATVIPTTPDSHAALIEPTTGSDNSRDSADSSPRDASPAKVDSNATAADLARKTRPDTEKSGAAGKSSQTNPPKADRRPAEREKAVAPSASLQLGANTSAPASAGGTTSQKDAKYLQEEAAADQALERASAAPALPAPSVSTPAEPTSTTSTGNTAKATPPAPPKLPTGSVDVRVPPFPSMRIPAELKTQVSAGGQSVQMGQVISRTQPQYPPDALSQGVQGMVKAHVAINSDGTVGAVDATGPPPLVEAATAALREWRYKPTRLNGTAIPAEEDVVFIFRLSGTSTN